MENTVAAIGRDNTRGRLLAAAHVHGSRSKTTLRNVEISIHELPWVGLQVGRRSRHIHRRSAPIRQGRQLAIVQWLTRAVLHIGLQLLLDLLYQVLVIRILPVLQLRVAAMTLVVLRDMTHVVVVVPSICVLSQERSWRLILLLLVTLVVELHTVLLLAVVAQDVKVVLLLLLLANHHLLQLLLLHAGWRVDLLLCAGQVLYRSHQERRLHVSSRIVVVLLGLTAAGKHVLGELLTVLLGKVLAAAVLPSLLCLVVSLHIVVNLVLHQVVFAPCLAHVAAYLLVTVGFDEVLEHLGEVVGLGSVDHIGGAIVLEHLAEHGLREALALEAGAVLVAVLHVQEILQILEELVLRLLTVGLHVLAVVLHALVASRHVPNVACQRRAGSAHVRRAGMIVIVEHAGNVLRAALTCQVAQELHLEGLKVATSVLVLAMRHLLLVHGISAISHSSHHVPLLVAVVEEALQVLGKLHLTVHLAHLLAIVLLLRLAVRAKLTLVLLAPANCARGRPSISHTILLR